MHPDLLAYAAGGLDDSARAQFEALLRGDAELRRQLDRVRRRLAPLREDVACESPPPDLVVKTLAFVAEHACRDLPHAPAETAVSRAPFDRPWWRRVDVMVAASIAVTVVGLMLPALLHLRVLGLQTQCANNLRQLWTGLDAYQTQRASLPDVSHAKRPVAGMVIPILRDAGVLPTRLAAWCPGAADATACLDVGVDDLANMPGREFESATAKLLPGYAYSLGFRDDAGNLHGPATTLPDVPAARLPLLADAPGARVAVGNSGNHACRGQNVLFTDGHVDFKTTRAAGPFGDDIYLNKSQKVAAGIDTHDIVLGNGGATP